VSTAYSVGTVYGGKGHLYTPGVRPALLATPCLASLVTPRRFAGDHPARPVHNTAIFPKLRAYPLVTIRSNALLQSLNVSRATLPFKFSAVLPVKLSTVLPFKFRGLVNALVTLMWFVFDLNIGEVLILVTGA
jgi:hypothetical protein